MEERKIKILCVEDDLEIRENISEILRDEGFEVFEASDGKQGFDSFLNCKPDLIISDIMMPNIDGYGFLKMVRESKGKINLTPFIFLSALGQKENIIKGSDLLANDYLIKPIDFDLLISKIKEKTKNFLKIGKIHNENIKNLKSQISTVLPLEVFSYIDSIIKISQVLKEEPYGPFPHRRYLEDLSKITIDSMKLKNSIINSLNHKVLDNKLNEDEEIFSLIDFIDHATHNLNEKLHNKIFFDRPYEAELLPKIKFNKPILIDILKKIILSIVKNDNNSSFTISIMMDSLNRMAVIFYIKSQLNLDSIENFIEYSKLSQTLLDQGCDVKISQKNTQIDSNIIISIPDYRLIK